MKNTETESGLKSFMLAKPKPKTKIAAEKKLHDMRRFVRCVDENRDTVGAYSAGLALRRKLGFTAEQMFDDGDCAPKMLTRLCYEFCTAEISKDDAMNS